MYSNLSKAAFIAIVLAACSGPKNIAKTDTQTEDNLKAHVEYLADDKLEGRRTGTKGEELAMQYKETPSTVLQVVRNPSWLTPYAGCAIVSAGMIVQFMIHLVGFVSRRKKVTA